jgi:hypothetical protein
MNSETRRLRSGFFGDFMVVSIDFGASGDLRSPDHRPWTCGNWGARTAWTAAGEV